jgi:hypothetical protein
MLLFSDLALIDRFPKSCQVWVLLAIRESGGFANDNFLSATKILVDSESPIELPIPWHYVAPYHGTVAYIGPFHGSSGLNNLGKNASSLQGKRPPGSQIVLLSQ